MRRITRLIQRNTREGFRLLAAWVLGLITFGFLSELSRKAVLYFQPWKSANLADSDAVLFLLLVLLGLVFLAVVAALVFEGLDKHRAGATILTE
jgi:H+/Cl- antiporter ClcA